MYRDCLKGIAAAITAFRSKKKRKEDDERKKTKIEVVF